MASSKNKVEAATDTDEDASMGKNPHKHDSGAADLEKVTDFVEEKELSFSTASVSNLIGKEPSERAKEAARVVIRKEDVELMIRELEVTKATAEKKLREHRGNVKEAMMDILAF